MFKALKKWFTKPQSRRDVIHNNFNPFLKQIVFKYDYFLHLDPFLKNEHMSAMTIFLTERS